MDADFNKGEESGYKRTKKAIGDAKKNLLKDNSELKLNELIIKRMECPKL